MARRAYFTTARVRHGLFDRQSGFPVYRCLYCRVTRLTAVEIVTHEVGCEARPVVERARSLAEQRYQIKQERDYGTSHTYARRGR